MRIAYVVRHIDSAGGRERVLTNKANYLVRRFGYEVFIITIQQVLGRTVFGLDERVQVRHLSLGDAEKYKGGRLRYYLHIKRALETELSAIEPDITISMWWAGEFRVLPFLRDGSRKILELHGSKYERSHTHQNALKSVRGRIRWAVTDWLDDWIVDRYDRFVVLTEEDGRTWRHGHMTVIPNALSFVSYWSSGCANPVIVSAGRLTESKGFDRLIELWAAVEADYPEWSLRIFGDGEEKENLSRLIEARGLQRVALLPTTPNIEAEMLKASIFAFASRYEGFGMVLTEAMQCGLPVVSYATQCGPAEIIDDEVSGFVVKEGDAATFVARLRRLIEDPVLRRAMGSAAKRLSTGKFGPDAVMLRWKALFEELVPRT